MRKEMALMLVKHKMAMVKGGRAYRSCAWISMRALCLDVLYGSLYIYSAAWECECNRRGVYVLWSIV